MKLTIFGSTGKTGKHLVRKALERGHEVVAFARTPEKLDIQHKDLTIFQGDTKNADPVAQAIKGANGVINAIGRTPCSPNDLMQTTAENIVAGMQKHQVDRLIWSTGAGVPAPDDEPTVMHKAINLLLKLLSGKVLDNSLRGAEVIQDSNLHWTIARAPMLTDEKGSGHYHASYVDPSFGRTLSRENFADFMLDLVESEQWACDMPAASDTENSQ